MKRLAGVPIGSGMTPSRTRFARFLRNRRLEELELSQVKMAKRAGMGQSHYSGFETGLYRFIQLYNLRRLARAARVNVKKLQTLIPKRHELPPRTKLGCIILSLRTKSGLSRKELAERSEMSVDTLYCLEMGEWVKLLPRTARKLAKGLGVHHTVFRNYIRLSRTATKGAMGRKIRARRVELCFSQAELARKIRRTRQYVSKVETGRIPLSTGGRPVKAFERALHFKSGTLSALQPKKRKFKKIPTKKDSFAECLVTNRHARHLNQTNMTEQLQTSTTSLSKWER